MLCIILDKNYFGYILSWIKCVKRYRIWRGDIKKEEKYE